MSFLFSLLLIAPTFLFAEDWPLPYLCEANCCYTEAKIKKCDYMVADDENMVSAYKKMKTECQNFLVRKSLDPNDGWLETLDGASKAYVGNSCRKID